LWLDDGRSQQVRHQYHVQPGTVVGVSANIFGSGFPQFCSEFSWGGASGLRLTSLKKAFETALIGHESKKR
jgi:hypothetical protein